MAKKTTVIEVLGTEIAVASHPQGDYISLTDMLRAKDGDFFIADWLRNRNTVEFLGIWESVHNPDFNCGGFATIKSQAGLNHYKISVKEWRSPSSRRSHRPARQSAGRYGGTYAHKDIAFESGMWISPEFEIYLIMEFQRLQGRGERPAAPVEWNLQRTLAKINYRIHSRRHQGNPAAGRNYQGPGGDGLCQRSGCCSMSSMFGQTAKEWRERNPGAEGNIRDQGSLDQLRGPDQPRIAQCRADPARPIASSNGCPDSIRSPLRRCARCSPAAP